MAKIFSKRGVIPITIKQLREYRHVKANILLLKQELDELILKSNVCENVGRSGKTPDTVAQIVLDREKVRRRIESLTERKNAVEGWLSRCEDYYGLLLRWHYAEGRTWTSIALTLGGGNTEDGVRMACHRFVRQNP